MQKMENNEQTIISEHIAEVATILAVGIIRHMKSQSREVSAEGADL